MYRYAIYVLYILYSNHSMAIMHIRVKHICVYICMYYIPTDIDECLTYPCDSNATCNNTDGSYICTCNTGYTGSGEICESTFVTLFYYATLFRG